MFYVFIGLLNLALLWVGVSELLAQGRVLECVVSLLAVALIVGYCAKQVRDE